MIHWIILISWILLFPLVAAFLIRLMKPTKVWQKLTIAITYGSLWIGVAIILW